MANTTRTGKIARLQAATRTALNLRLQDGQSSAQILPWLNGLPEVRAILKAQFEDVDVSDENLSNWRQGGYQEWLKNQERMERIRAMTNLAADMAEASGGSPADPACDIAAGRIIEVIDSLAEDDLAKILPALTALRNAQTAALRAATDRARASLSAEALALEKKKWANRAAEAMLDALEDRIAKAQEIASSGVSRTEKIKKLVNEFFEE